MFRIRRCIVDSCNRKDSKFRFVTQINTILSTTFIDTRSPLHLELWIAQTIFFISEIDLLLLLLLDIWEYKSDRSVSIHTRNIRKQRICLKQYPIHTSLIPLCLLRLVLTVSELWQKCLSCRKLSSKADYRVDEFRTSWVSRWMSHTVFCCSYRLGAKRRYFTTDNYPVWQLTWQVCLILFKKLVQGIRK